MYKKCNQYKIPIILYIKVGKKSWEEIMSECLEKKNPYKHKNYINNKIT